jgi:hypothetical protein
MKNEDLLSGDINPIRDYVITLGQSSNSKGIMFVLYSVLRKPTSAYVSPLTYLGILADDIDTAIINARKRIPKFKLIIEDYETLRDRRHPLNMPFGKYKGESIETIFDKDEKYIYWLLNSDSIKYIKSNSLYEKIVEYAQIAKENIIISNKEKTNNALPIDANAVERKLTIYSAHIDDSIFGYNNVTYKFKMKDEFGNLYSYQGSSEIFVQHFSEVIHKNNIDILVKCKVSGNFEAMGLIFNKIKLR